MTRKARIVAALVAATLTFTSSPALWAQDASHKFTAMDEFQLQRPTDPQISPDGKKIAYVRRFADPMRDGSNSTNRSWSQPPRIYVAFMFVAI